MGIFSNISPVLDGALVALDGGASRSRRLRIPAGTYPTPFWLRTEAGLVIPVSSLPWQGVIPAGSLQVLSADPSAGVAPSFVEDFSGWTSTSDFINRGKSSGMYSNEDNNAQHISLDQNVGYGSLTQSVLYTYPAYDYGQPGATCGDLSVGRNLTLPTPQTEIWAEIWFQTEDWLPYPGYPGSMVGACGGGYNPDFKFLFGRMNGPGDPSRFEVLLGNSVNVNAVTGYPGNEAAYQLGLSSVVLGLFNGLWHRIRVHWKYSTTAGIVELWIDDTKRHSTSGIAMASNQGQIWSLALGRNRDPKPGTIQKLRLGKASVWYGGNDPLWP